MNDDDDRGRWAGPLGWGQKPEEASASPKKRISQMQQRRQIQCSKYATAGNDGGGGGKAEVGLAPGLFNPPG